MELSEELEQLRDECDKKMEDLPSILDDYGKWQKAVDEIWAPFKEKLREFKLTAEYKLKEIPGYGDLFPMENFVGNVESGGFIDYDGSGNYATKDQMSDIAINPSDIRSGVYRKDFTHVVWFNK